MHSSISAVLVTRGNVDLSPIIETLPFDDIIVWDNSRKKTDIAVLGRYRAMFDAKNDIVYVQDDDCIVPVSQMVAQWNEDPRVMLCNMPADHGTYTDSALVGWGCIMNRNWAWNALSRYVEFFPLNEDKSLYMTADIPVTVLNRFRRVDFGHQNFDYAYGLDRMYHRDSHDTEREIALQRARYVRDFPHPYWSDTQ